MAEFDYPPVDFETHPSLYKHWDLRVDGEIATLTMQVDEHGGMWPGRYELKLNSYDLGVDIELNDAAHRLRFEHPEVRADQRAVHQELTSHAICLMSDPEDRVVCVEQGVNL